MSTTDVRRKQAKQLVAQGMTQAAAARIMGVSQSYVSKLLDDRKLELLNARSKAWIRSGVCPDCGGPMTHPNHGLMTRGKETQRCIACSIGRIRQEAIDRNVRGRTMRCRLCKQFKDESEYPAGRLDRYLAGEIRRIGSCRTCDTEARRAYRESRKVPCANGCGTLVLARNEIEPKAYARGFEPTGMCRACVMKTMRTRRTSPPAIDETPARE